MDFSIIKSCTTFNMLQHWQGAIMIYPYNTTHYKGQIQSKTAENNK